MNLVKIRRNHLRRKWRWVRRDSIECPHCKRFIQIEPTQLLKQHHYNCGTSDDRILRRQRPRKTDVVVWQESHDSEPIYCEALTPRQTELLDVLAEGAPTNEQIAEKLGISRHTVEKHLSDIYQRLGVTSRYEAILWTLRHRQKVSKNT